MLLVTTIRAMQAADWPQVEAIFTVGIQAGEATFETTTPSWAQFDAGKIPDARLVAVDDTGAVVGWAAASLVSAREVYSGVIEHSVYIHPDHHGHGIGRQLLAAFIAEAEDAGYWMIQSSVFPQNIASLRLHERAGFRVVGHRERIARNLLGPHAGHRRDTILIERRSTRNPRRTTHLAHHSRRSCRRPLRRARRPHPTRRQRSPLMPIIDAAILVGIKTVWPGAPARASLGARPVGRRRNGFRRRNDERGDPAGDLGRSGAGDPAPDRTRSPAADSV